MSRGAKHRDPPVTENKKDPDSISGAVDFSPFKQDIDDLIDEFCEHQSTSFTDMKRVWASRKFSCIYEASPSSNLTMYMQTLYAQCLGHMVSEESLSRRLGGLYCLYCLHETQPFKSPYRIYISLRELKNLKYLVTCAKEKGIAVVSHLVKRMLEKNMFYFGSVDINETSVSETVNQLTELQNAQVKLAYKMLFSNTRMEHLLLMDLDKEVGMDAVKKSLSGYVEAKNEAIREARGMTDVQSIEHLIDDKGAARVVLEGITDAWNAERDTFLQETEFNRCDVNKQQMEPQTLLIGDRRPKHQDEDDGNEEEDEDFEQKLEDLLSDF